MKEKILSTSGIKIIFKILCIFLVLVLFLAAVQRLLVPKYVGKMAEGSLVEEYYDAKKDNDIIFLGDSEVYYNFSPQVLSDEYGINSYIRGSAAQTMWQSYYLLLDTLRYETPEMVVVSVSSMMKSEGDSEAYNRMTIDGMEWSQYKIDCINASMLEEESFISYVFPILRYHSRWSELTSEDFENYFSEEQVSENGYIARTEVVPLGQLPAVKPLENDKLSSKAFYYLDEIRKVCEENGIKILLMKSPSQYPHWYEEWNGQVTDYAEKYDLTYVNLLDYTLEIGLNFETDTFDGGLHLNVDGAKKNTEFFGKILLEELEK